MHYTAQAAQGVHEDRTLTQLRADVAAALLLRQSMAENSIHAPAAVDRQYEEAPLDFQDSAANFQDYGRTEEANGGSSDMASSDSPANLILTTGPSPGANLGDAPGSETGAVALLPWLLRTEPESCDVGAYPDPKYGDTMPYDWQIPVFEDPDYRNPGFVEPDPRNYPDWHPTAQLPLLTSAGSRPFKGPLLGVPDGSEGQSASTGSARAEAWPPLPQVTPVVLIPALSLLGETNEPAWMEGVGPMSMEVAKKLTVQAGSFLRVLVDPISNKPLDIAPDRYRVNQAMRTMLLIREECCQFPGCMAKAINCEVDHIKSFESGGRTIFNNLENLCAHHHLVKHYKDDKNRYGRLRCIDEPERVDLRLRGWTPRMEDGGRVSWTSPSGRYCPPEAADTQPPAYPEWMKDVIDGERAAGRAGSLETRGEWDESDNQPEPPPEFRLDGEDDEILTQMAIRRGLEQPNLGLAEAA